MPYFLNIPALIVSNTTGIWVFVRGGTTWDNGDVSCNSATSISICIQIWTDKLLMMCSSLVVVEYTQTSPKSRVEGPELYKK